MMAKASGKGRQQAQAAQHQPGFVAVPDRRDGIHQQIARGFAVGEIVENADAQIEAVQQHIEEHRQAQDQRPHRHEIEDHGASPGTGLTGAAGRPAPTGAIALGARRRRARCARTIHSPAGNMMQ